MLDTLTQFSNTYLTWLPPQLHVFFMALVLLMVLSLGFKLFKWHFLWIILILSLIPAALSFYKALRI